MLIILSSVSAALLMLIFRKKIRFRHYYSTMLTMSYLRFLEQYVLINMADVWVYHRLPLPISKIIHIPIMLDVTIYPLLGYLFIRFVPKRPVYTLLYYFIAALALLLVEFGLVFTGYLEHLNEWNFILSYYLAFSTFLIVHWQYKLFVLILPAVNDSSKIV